MIGCRYQRLFWLPTKIDTIEPATRQPNLNFLKCCFHMKTEARWNRDEHILERPSKKTKSVFLLGLLFWLKTFINLSLYIYNQHDKY